MTSAQEMREKTEAAVYENIKKLLAHRADMGFSEVDLSDYDTLFLTEAMEKKLIADGYEIFGRVIKW